ncbi:MAG: hypothetical protein OXU61_03480 [Gammaproteobacteria bacterium]|nr:hypothetical protein [Gammaproteobacteria bacterium]
MKWVLKVGGSLYARPELARALAHAAQIGGGADSGVIVPGGGPFADQVRRAQGRWRFADDAAHRMALLGMRQYGHMLSALSGLEAIEKTPGAAPGCAVWLPTEREPAWLPDGLAAPAPDWDLSSDSIAASLAARIGAQWLAFLKPVPLRRAGAFAALVDPHCRGIAQGRLRVACLALEEWLALKTLARLENHEAPLS